MMRTSLSGVSPAWTIASRIAMSVAPPNAFTATVLPLRSFVDLIGESALTPKICEYQGPSCARSAMPLIGSLAVVIDVARVENASAAMSIWLPASACTCNGLPLKRKNSTV